MIYRVTTIVSIPRVRNCDQAPTPAARDWTASDRPATRPPTKGISTTDTLVTARGATRAPRPHTPNAARSARGGRLAAQAGKAEAIARRAYPGTANPPGRPSIWRDATGDEARRNRLGGFGRSVAIFTQHDPDGASAPTRKKSTLRNRSVAPAASTHSSRLLKLCAVRDKDEGRGPTASVGMVGLVHARGVYRPAIFRCARLAPLHSARGARRLRRLMMGARKMAARFKIQIGPR